MTGQKAGDRRARLLLPYKSPSTTTWRIPITRQDGGSGPHRRRWYGRRSTAPQPRTTVVSRTSLDLWTQAGGYRKAIVTIGLF